MGPWGLGRAKFLSPASLPRAAGLGYRGWACTAAGSSLAANEGGPSPGVAARPFLPPGGCGCGEPGPYVAALCTVLVRCGGERRIQIETLPSAFAKKNIILAVSPTAPSKRSQLFNSHVCVYLNGGLNIPCRFGSSFPARSCWGPCGRLASRPAGRSGPGERRSVRPRAPRGWLHPHVELQRGFFWKRHHHVVACPLGALWVVECP